MSPQSSNLRSQLESIRARARSLSRLSCATGCSEWDHPLCWIAHELDSALSNAPETGCSGELRAVCEEIRNKAQSSVGNYGLGNFVAIHRELLGSMCAILDRTTPETKAPLFIGVDLARPGSDSSVYSCPHRTSHVPCPHCWAPHSPEKSTVRPLADMLAEHKADPDKAPQIEKARHTINKAPQ